MLDLSGWQIERKDASGSGSTQWANSEADALEKVREILSETATVRVVIKRISADGTVAE